MRKRKFDYDVIVIGSGIAGSEAAKNLAKSGFKVAIFEEKAWGGSSINRSTLPYVSLMSASKLLCQTQRGAELGFSSENARFNIPSLTAWSANVARESSIKIKQTLVDAGIECIEGRARLLSKTEVVCDEKVWTAKSIVLACGSKTKISGIRLNTEILTPSDIPKMKMPPENAVVCGAGATGVEIAQYLQAIGVKVTLIENAERILPHKDIEVSELMREVLEKDGIKVLTSSRILEIANNAEKKRVVFSRGGEDKHIEVDEVILCTGNKANTDLGLENASVVYLQSGVEVSASMRTSTKNIYACGDIIGGEIMPDLAILQAQLVAKTISGESGLLIDAEAVIHNIYSYPEIAEIGLSEDDLRRKGTKYKVATTPIYNTKKSKASGDDLGFVKIICGRGRKILGATIVAPDAGILMQELAFAKFHGLSIDYIAATPHLAFDYSDAIQKTAEKLI